MPQEILNSCYALLQQHNIWTITSSVPFLLVFRFFASLIEISSTPVRIFVTVILLFPFNFARKISPSVQSSDCFLLQKGKRYIAIQTFQKIAVGFHFVLKELIFFLLKQSSTIFQIAYSSTVTVYLLYQEMLLWSNH